VSAGLPWQLSIESPFPEQRYILRLLEPSGSSRQYLRQRLFDGNHDKPFVIDNGSHRT
jgi:hypothetical protein